MNELPQFELRRVRKQYGRTVAVDVEHLRIAAGETLCLLGPTGAGKSVLLRLLAAVERPTAGEVRFEGRDYRGDRLPCETRRRITLVFQRPILLSGSVSRNVAYGLRLRACTDCPKTEVERILAHLGIAHLADRPVRTLSGGQAQLVALARALILKPDVLLLDEPTAHLDPAHVALVERVLREVAAFHPITLVWATHNLFQARRVGQRVGLLLKGRLIEVAAADVFFREPADPRTRDFVEGRMIY